MFWYWWFSTKLFYKSYLNCRRRCGSLEQNGRSANWGGMWERSTSLPNGWQRGIQELVWAFLLLMDKNVGEAACRIGLQTHVPVIPVFTVVKITRIPISGFVNTSNAQLLGASGGSGAGPATTPQWLVLGARHSLLRTAVLGVHGQSQLSPGGPGWRSECFLRWKIDWTQDQLSNLRFRSG